MEAKGNSPGIDCELNNLAINELEALVKLRSGELIKINEELQLQAAILDKATDAIFLRGMDNIIVYANETACQMYGYSKEEFIGKHVRSLISPRESPYYEERQRTVRGTGEITVEGYHVRKDKSEIPIEVHSHLINIGNREYILAVVRDVTGRIQNQEKLKQSEMQFQKLFDAMNEGVALIDLEGTIVKANIAEAKMMGFASPEEMEGKKVTNPLMPRIFPDGTMVPKDWTVFGMVTKSKHPVKDIVLGHITMEGNIRWFSFNAAPLFDSTGNVSGVVRTLTDITKQKQLQDEKEQFTRRLITVQEEERKRIARELHDDTAQNLALLMLEVDALLDTEEDLSAKVVEKLGKLKEDAGRTQKDVRRYSHELRPGVLENLGLEAALESLVDDSNARNGAKITFNIEGKGRRLTEEMELALFRIAQEAVTNIWKHAEASQAEIVLKYTSRKVGLNVTDNGKGFNPVKKKASGTTGGLGLIGMEERAELIGAKIKIKSSPGKGTVIAVEAHTP